MEHTFDSIASLCNNGVKVAPVANCISLPIIVDSQSNFKGQPSPTNRPTLIQTLFRFIEGVDKSDQIEKIVLEFVPSFLVDLIDEKVPTLILII
jgi:hypothetical protein